MKIFSRNKSQYYLKSDINRMKMSSVSNKWGISMKQESQYRNSASGQDGIIGTRSMLRSETIKKINKIMKKWFSRCWASQNEEKGFLGSGVGRNMSSRKTHAHCIKSCQPGT